MFKCDNCKKSCAGKPTRKVIGTRDARYPMRTKRVRNPLDGEFQHKVIDRGGSGKQIVREVVVCGDCT